MDICRKENCLLGCDEFYATFAYEEDGSPSKEPVSVLPFIEDVNKDFAIPVGELRGWSDLNT